MQEMAKSMERTQKICRVTLWGGVMNALLLAFKFVAGIMGHSAAMVKRLTGSDGAYQSVYFLNSGLDTAAIRERVPELFTDKTCGSVFRVKGFFFDDGWQELNATAREMLLQPIPRGQDVLIVIGEALNEAAIKSILQL